MCLELSSPKIFLPIHLWRGQRYRRVWSWRFPTFCCLDSEKHAKGRGDSPSPTKNGRVAKKKNWGWDGGGSGLPEACTDPYHTRAPGPLSKKRVKLWPSRKWGRAGPRTTRRKPEGPSTTGEKTNKVAPQSRPGQPLEKPKVQQEQVSRPCFSSAAWQQPARPGVLRAATVTT